MDEERATQSEPGQERPEAGPPAEAAGAEPGGADAAPRPGAEAEAEAPAAEPADTGGDPERPGEGREQAAAADEAAVLTAPARLRRGEIRKGIVVRVEADHLLVDVGARAEGIVPLSELSLAPGQDPREVYREGQEIEVQVRTTDPRGEGGAILSERRARAERAWARLQEAFASGQPIEAPVTEQVKGGLVLDVGVRAFMPASHVERRFVADLSGYVGKVLAAKVIELDRSRNRVVLSRRQYLEEELERRRQATWESLAEGQVRTGVVKGITDFGAFVDLGGVDGLLHVSEMSWGRVTHPSEVVQEGQEIQVKVLKVDRERGRVSLGLRQVLPDPWESVEHKYPVGSVVEGRVVRLVPFGCFVELEPGVEGLVHISQLADRRVNAPDEVVREGETVRVRVLRLQPVERRISLSIREANPRPRPARERAPRAVRTAGDGQDTVTLGDVFGELLEDTRERLAHAARQLDGQTAGDGESEA